MAKERYSVKNVYNQFKQQLPDLLENLPKIPPMLFQAVEQLQEKASDPIKDKHSPN